MSFFSINALGPLIQQPANSFHERLDANLSNESYAISVERGFETAAFILKGDIEYLRGWFDNGLARDMTFVGPDGKVSWEGFVNSMALSFGGIQLKHGLDRMGNRIIYTYTPLNTGVNPPTEGTETTITKNDTDSQALYGIKLATVRADKATPATAADTAALTALTERAYPTRGQSSRIGASSEPSLHVDLRGYAFMADWYNYSQTISSGTDTATAILKLVLAADPNGILSTDDRDIGTNSEATEAYWQDTAAWKVVRTIINRGETVGGIGIPWAGGIYEGRRLIFKKAERLDANGNPVSTNQYQRLFHAPSVDVFSDESGASVPPWHLRPDRIVIAESLGAQMYVRRVNYTPPIKVTLSGEDNVYDVQSLLVSSI
jgi:hypothetical protein